MLRQYHAPTRRGGFNPFAVGTLNLGDTVYLQDAVRPLAGLSPFAPIIRREPWVVTGFANREYCATLPACPVTYMAGGHLVEVKSLRSGRTARVADWLVRYHVEAGFIKSEGTPLPIPVGNRAELPPAVRRNRRKVA